MGYCSHMYSDIIGIKLFITDIGHITIHKPLRDFAADMGMQTWPKVMKLKLSLSREAEALPFWKHEAEAELEALTC